MTDHPRGDIGGILNRILGGSSPGMIAFVQMAEGKSVFRDPLMKEVGGLFLQADNQGLWDSAWIDSDRCVIQVTDARGRPVTEFPLAW